VELTSLDQVHDQYRHIYFQPHFDDAALSCGGSIVLQVATGQHVLLVTVFGGIPPEGMPLSPFARVLQQRTGLNPDAAEATRQRRQEELAAAEVLGADILFLDNLEALYRGSPPYYQSEEALFGLVNPADLALDEQLARVFLDIHERAPLAALYAPLGVGHHVDHQLCCSAADRLAQRRLNVKFYEDFPYVTRQGALEGRQRELGIAMEPEMVEVSGTLRQREEAISRYTSQVPQLFGGEDQMLSAVRGYANSLRKTYPGIQIERFWRW
jgi:LmbE family N-acetylglucosaminyl deacetylase